jgi:hypothetical protein
MFINFRNVYLIMILFVNKQVYSHHYNNKNIEILITKKLPHQICCFLLFGHLKTVLFLDTSLEMFKQY